ncbi:MAG: cation diffusion facilitator family transporter [Chloroflexi bacterium]|nr:cation diffusion facilitator family transporter [Chloroflexota bacterium]
MSHDRDKKSLLAVNLGLSINIGLAALKTYIGVIGHSPALLAEGINSTSDVAYYIVASIFVRMATKPADDEHPYGHQQLESIAAVVVGSFIVTTAVAVFWDAVDKIWDLLSGHSSSQGASSAALWMALVTVGIKLFLTYYVRKLGKETKNPVVEAMAYDHRNDLLSAAAASVGIFLGQRGLPWVDPLAGAIVALLILRTGIYILRESSVELMDAVPSKDLAGQISEILRNVPGVEQLQEVQAHRFGPHSVVNVTVGVDGNIAVKDGDEIASRVEALLYNNIPNLRRVHVHYHPSDKDHQNMTIDQILAEARKHIVDYHPQYFD